MYIIDLFNSSMGLEGTAALMLDHGANVMARDRHGNTAMHMLVQFGRGEKWMLGFQFVVQIV